MGVASAACRPIKWDEYIMLLLAARLVFFPVGETNVHDTCGHDASVAFKLAELTILCVWTQQTFSRTSATRFAFN
jgi:hypothetical protein